MPSHKMFGNSSGVQRGAIGKLEWNNEIYVQEDYSNEKVG